MERYLFCISFNGIAYCGWQIQKNGVSVQAVVQKAIEEVVGCKVFIVSCSRTDSKVHANNFYFHSDLKLNISLSNLKLAINNKLNEDIILKSIVKVNKNFHARYSAKTKEYLYKIWLGELKNPFLKGLVLNYERSLNLNLMKKAAKFFIGRHNFTAFCNAKTVVLDKVREIYLLDIYKKKNILIFKIRGNGFLYNMVRIIVGTLLEVSEGLIEPCEINRIIESKDRKNSGRTVAACGLYLNKVIY